jgi:hypothetical protein
MTGFLIGLSKKARFFENFELFQLRFFKIVLRTPYKNDIFHDFIKFISTQKAPKKGRF